ncbi:N-6 DNA methylase [Methanohalobium evestigatum Z-7303]|uniref:site-specific DNA-methyltransferase (adenine-specific) n=1 Tax=Methanohalobium evestigatum (strain ATCC BAA-1072 / DSM 3721 / NBRC 107634 / OCM 161 / Z-7303) TaxID=644295 RepID=D7E680_METEZ|nr:N-6 DNA methylase [Methanohalobium evestigatum]ADI73102.1 N-6 DNA methylase [Methanohalobium evestigatum Z-7303]
MEEDFTNNFEKNLNKKFGKNLHNKLGLKTEYLPISNPINHVLSLMLLKKLSEQYEHGVKHIVLPASAYWTNIKSSYNDIGNLLNNAFEELEMKNPEIKGVFDSLDFESNELGNVHHKNEIWKSIIDSLSSIELYNENLEPNYDFERLFDVFTPRKLAYLVVKLLNIDKDMTVYEPFCTLGTFLVRSGNYIKECTGEFDEPYLYGQSPNKEYRLTTMLNLYFNDFFKAQVKSGNLIFNPQFLTEDGDGVRKFDRVLGSYPIIKDWGYEFAKYDPYRRFSYGVPPQKKGDYAYIEHMVASLKKDGMMGVLVPNNSLSRTNEKETKIKQLMLKRDDLIESVISLPPKVLRSTATSYSLLIINKNKREERRNQVLFIDASREYRPRKTEVTRNVIKYKHIDNIVSTYQSFKDEDNFSSVVPIEKIEKHNFSLDVSSYILPEPIESDVINPNDALSRLREIQNDKNELINNIHDTYSALNLDKGYDD